MKKIIFTLFFILQSVAFANQQIACHFSASGVYDTTTGQKVSSSLSPQILKSVTSLDLDKSKQDIYITSMQDFNLNLMGDTCKDEARQGFDCYMLTSQTLKRELKAYSSNANQKLLQLVTPTGAPGKFVQQDTYSCNQ